MIMAAKKTKKKPARKQAEATCQRFMRTACIQMKHGAVPAAVAVTTSVVIGKLGAPVVVLALLAAGGVAWWKGYRIRVVKLDGE